MTSRPTSIWVPIDRLVPHPRNPNRMSKEHFDKLVRNIDASGNMPIIIVRSLEISQEFTDEFQKGLLQILDGEHRWKYAKFKEQKEVEIRVWPNVSDERAWSFLLTLNHLRGSDDKKKREALIRDLGNVVGDPEELAAILPENIKDLAKLSGETAAAVKNASERARSISRQEPVTIFALPEQAELIRRAIKTRLDKGVDCDECREGEALKEICVEYLENQ